MVKAAEAATVEPNVHPEGIEHFLPSGLVLREKPMNGDTYLQYQGKVVGFSVKGGSASFSTPTQWLATKMFEVVTEGGEAKPLDLGTIAMGLDFDDAATLNSIVNKLLTPEEPEEGMLPSGKTLERLKVKGQDYWAYQDKIGNAIDRKTGNVGNGDALVSANISLATKMFTVDGEAISEAWMRSATFADCAVLMGAVGKRIQAIQPQ